MVILATAMIDGDETTGRAELVQADDGMITLELHDLNLAPGAPDARLYVSTSSVRGFDETAVELGQVPDGEPRLTWPLPDVDPAGLRSVIVYCKEYSVLFGWGAFSR
jgi:hypothetical protein